MAAMTGTLKPAAWALLLAQLAHVAASFLGSANADAPSSEGVVGLPLGLLAIAANVVVLVGLHRGRAWAPRYAALVGFAVAAGFVVYHGLPFHSWATNPYVGTGADAVDWAGVVVCIAAGAWCAWAGFPRRAAAST
jgi:hypothetical protein